MSSSVIFPVTGADVARSVSENEYKRLLNLPRSRILSEDLLERANAARQWYESFGRPFIASARATVKAASANEVHLSEGTQLRSAALAERFRSGDAHAVVVLAASAGIEVASEVAKHWAEGRPDEAFFLDRFAAAITEHLIQWAAVHLCQSGGRIQETLLPHLSPGCAGWDLMDQHKLMAVLSSETTVGPIRLLPSGALYPQHSVLAALGVSRKKYSQDSQEICQSCDLDPCAFRRAPFKRD